MNYWNGTCDISNLPILKNESVILIPLYKVSEHMVTNCCYPADNFAPFAFPILGRYNGLGGVFDTLTTDQNKEFLLSREFYTAGHNDDISYERCPDYDDFDDFVQNVLCCKDTIFVKLENRLSVSRYAEIAFMMVHQGVFSVLLNEIGDRIPYGQTDSYSSLLYKHFLQQMSEYRQQYNRCHTDEPSEMTSIMLKNIYNNICRTVFTVGSASEAEYWQYCAKMCMRDPADEIDIVASAVELTVFTTALSYMCKGYLCDSGFGSQAEETHLHVVLAQFILKQARKDCDTSLGVRDAIYWYEPIS